MSSPTYPQPLQPVVPLDADSGWGPLAIYTNAGEALANSTSTSDDAVLGRPGEIGGPHLPASADEAHWSTTTYSGPRRHRPAREPNQVPADSAEPDTAEPDTADPATADVAEADPATAEPVGSDPTQSRVAAAGPRHVGIGGDPVHLGADERRRDVGGAARDRDRDR